MIAKKILIIASVILFLEKVNGSDERTCFCELHVKTNQEYSIGFDRWNIEMAPKTSCKTSQAELCTEECFQNKIEKTVLANPSNAADYCSRISADDKNKHIDAGFRLEMEKSYSSCEGWTHKTANPSRLCCETKCSCAISYKSNNKTIPLQVNIPLRDGDKNARFDNYCGNSIGDCLSHCRKEVGNFLNVPDIPLDQTTADANIFYGPLNDNGVTTTKLCKMMSHTPYPGNAVFVEFESGYTNAYPHKEKIFIGNLCCLDLSTISPSLIWIVADPNCVGRKQIIDL